MKDAMRSLKATTWGSERPSSTSTILNSNTSNTGPGYIAVFTTHADYLEDIYLTDILLPVMDSSKTAYLHL
jgi:hypothetical protein